MAKMIDITLDFEADLEAHLKSQFIDMFDYRITNEALDARGASRGKRPKITYKIEIINRGENFSQNIEVISEDKRTQIKNNFSKKYSERPIVIGAGPAGLFAALRFAEYDIPCIVIERGERATKRMLSIAKFWRFGEFNSESNVCFGEGGAGLFSDGKLITRIKSPFVQYVMNKLVDFGAPKEVAYVSNPHLGSNKIREIINRISDYLKSKGTEFMYETRVDELIYEGQKVVGVKLNTGVKLYSQNVILAAGHSAKEMYLHLKKNQVSMKAKDFAIGVRVEHPRQLIDKIQYGEFCESKILGASRYRLSHQDKSTQKGTYSFCMCPGGYVLSSSTEKDGIVVNGMSNYSRGSRWSNAALVVTVEAEKDFKTDHDVLGGLEFIESIEKKAYQFSKEYASGKELPAQNLSDFLDNKKSTVLPVSSSPSKVISVEMSKILPSFVTNHLHNALFEFEKSMPGFITKDALFIAPETRTSAPVTILRDKTTLISQSHTGLYPCGEGAGYAGGITSAAVDGIRVVEAILNLE